jgi:hypothetical protein
VNPNWTDVDNFWDLIDHIWIGLVVIAAAAIPSVIAARNHGKIEKVSKQVTGVAAQVVNGHTTPMRKDMDDIKSVLDDMRGDVYGMKADVSGMKSDVSGMKSDVSDIRSELRQERRDRIDLDDRFEKFKRDR